DLNDILLVPTSVDRVDANALTNTGTNSRNAGGGGGGFGTGGGGGGFGGGNTGGGGGGGLFGDNNNRDSDDADEDREEQVEAIIELIQNAVPEDSWQINNVDARGTITERPRSGVL